jgi:transcriptional regulator of acetoin/glycerol metabolism
MHNLHERFTRTLEEWKKFISGTDLTEIDYSVVRPIILNAWIRSRNLHLNPRMKRISTLLSGEDLKNLLQENSELIETSIPFLETLYESMKGSQFLCTLCDSKGYILKIVGDKEIIESVKRGNFVPGALASEESIGPNGIGTALSLDSPVQVFATEHYCYHL